MDGVTLMLTPQLLAIVTAPQRPAATPQATNTARILSVRKLGQIKKCRPKAAPVNSNRDFARGFKIPVGC